MKNNSCAKAHHTPGPWKACLEMDGRNKYIAILSESAEFNNSDSWPYHPMIASVHHGNGHCSHDICKANSKLIAAAPMLLEMLQQIIAESSAPIEQSTLDKAKNLINDVQP